MKLQYIISLLFFVLLYKINAQNIVGFWEIKEVKVGSKTMTPVAKWTKINKNGTFQSGNGWLQNAEGTWEFDKSNNLYSPKETNGLIDEFGPFTVEFTDNGMNWLREEEGMIVSVTLKKVDQLPKGPADKVIGLWSLESIIKDNNNITATFDPNKKYYTFIRWDKIYVARSTKGKRNTGYWHMHGHKPEITFLPHNKDKKAETWKVEVSDHQLKLTGISDTNNTTLMTFKRLKRFPK